MNKPTILVVEDEADILELVAFNLEAAGFKVLKSKDGQQALNLARAQRPDLVVLDLLLPGLDGREVCRQLKRGKETDHIPVLILSALAEETDRVVGFEIGADDYLTKPFSPRELVLRARAILRRSQAPAPAAGLISRPGLVIDPERHQAELEGQPLELTVTEFKLLHHLAAHPGRVLSRELLLETVWGYQYQGYSRTVDTHVRRLRKKLGRHKDLIDTVRGLGYRFKEEA
jgi:two-component system phosphate regulon response regulator PhoB